MDIVKLCLEHGATKAEEIPVSKLKLQPELRQYCELNHCGLYKRNYTCPPYVGEIDTLIAKLRNFQRGIIWQNVYPLEDSFDFEGMDEAKNKHRAMTLEIARWVYEELGNSQALVLSAGGCTACPACGIQTAEPCRFPEQALVSLEAYGVNVSQISEVSSMRYINGANTVTYFSGVFI